MKHISILLFMALTALSVNVQAGVFGSEDSASAIEKGSARTLNKVLKGTVIQVSEAKIEEAAGARGVGASAGAGVGAVVGSTASGGRGSLVGGIVGAVAGGLIGAVGSAIAGKQTAQDIVIQLDSGDVVNITQAVDDKVGAFAEGDAVLVIQKGDSARVIRNKMGQAKVTPPAAEVAAPAAAPVASSGGE